MSRIFFPQSELDYSSKKSQSWGTELQTSGSGKSRSCTNQLYPTWTIEVKINHLTDAGARTLQGFTALLKGKAKSFFWLDPEDYQETGVQLPMVSTGVYQPVMRLGSYTEPVDYVDNLTVYVDGVKQDASGYSLTDAGYIKFNTAPATTSKVTADYRYYWHMRLYKDGFEVEHEFDDFNRAPSFKMVTARE